MDSCKVSLQSLCSKVNHGKNNHLQRFELDNDEASFNYVKDVLQLSGFIGNESLGKWYSLDQPLDPTLFKEIEAYLHQEVQSSDEFGGSSDHQLLFNLINEVLLEMYDKLFTYFPRTFSFNHHIRPMPKGHHVLEEVWARICWYLSFRSELDRSLDDIVAQDLSKGNGWMNHQFETECVALEMEELIFDELLDEVIFS
ncbi:protein TRM32 [Melia azedarach]|uniref:Protein TRM32 n=1 Tax=Melia azedarach TaxID=155640 RepID=A0ACC1YQU4_MELAZ|nr:protein TRM32 [Melia azedarach]